jgi:hypothetical protein
LIGVPSNWKSLRSLASGVRNSRRPSIPYPVAQQLSTATGADRGADRAAAITTLITTAKLNDVDPLAWLADVLARIADIPQTRLSDLLPWNWKQSQLQEAA